MKKCMEYKMNAFKVNRNSWHYKMNVATLESQHFSAHEIQNTMRFKANFCAYWRMSMINMLQIGFFVAIIVGVIGAILYGIFSLGVAAYANISVLYTAIAVIAFFATFFSVLMFFFKLSGKKKEKERKIARGEYIEPEHGLFKTKYISWKKKICPPVAYE